MSGGKETSGNKVLVGVLVFLCVAIAGLIVGIVVVNMNQPNGETEVEVEVSEDVPKVKDEAYIAAQEKAYQDYVAEYADVKEQVQQLFNSETVDLKKVTDLYQKAIDKNLKEGNYDRAGSFILTENRVLLEHNYRKEALDELLSIDYSGFSKAEQYRYYNMIVTQAEELGLNDIANEYAVLRAGVKEAWDWLYAETVKAREESERAARGEN